MRWFHSKSCTTKSEFTTILMENFQKTFENWLIKFNLHLLFIKCFRKHHQLNYIFVVKNIHRWSFVWNGPIDIFVVLLIGWIVIFSTLTFPMPKKWLKRREKEELNALLYISAVVIFVLLLFRFLPSTKRKVNFISFVTLFWLFLWQMIRNKKNWSAAHKSKNDRKYIEASW